MIAPSEEPIETRDTDTPHDTLDDHDTERPLAPCPICGARMRIIELLTPQPPDTA